MNRTSVLTIEFLDELFGAVGAYLAHEGESEAIVVVGGTTLIARGIVLRVTQDVDVIARALPQDDGLVLVPVEPWPSPLVDSVSQVARDFALPADWLNTVIGVQWEMGFPPHFESDIDWRTYSALTVGFVGRRGLIPLKLFAAVDQGPDSIHWQDLLALRPTLTEIDMAADWVKGQDAGTAFQSFVDQAVKRLKDELDRT